MQCEVGENTLEKGRFLFRFRLRMRYGKCKAVISRNGKVDKMPNPQRRIFLLRDLLNGLLIPPMTRALHAKGAEALYRRFNLGPRLRELPRK